MGSSWSAFVCWRDLVAAVAVHLRGIVTKRREDRLAMLTGTIQAAKKPRQRTAQGTVLTHRSSKFDFVEFLVSRLQRQTAVRASRRAAVGPAILDAFARPRPGRRRGRQRLPS